MLCCLYSEHERGVDEKGNEIKEQSCNFGSYIRFVKMPLTRPFRLEERRCITVYFCLTGERQTGRKYGPGSQCECPATAGDSIDSSISMYHFTKCNESKFQDPIHATNGLGGSRGITPPILKVGTT